MSVHSYSQLVSIIQNFATNHMQVQRFKAEFSDNLPNFGNEGNSYPILFMAPVGSEFLSNTDNYTVRFACFDLINQDRSNINTILSDTNLILNDLKKWFTEGDNYIWQIIGDPSATPLNNQLLDITAGWEMQVTFNVDSYCVDEIPFSGSPYISTNSVDIIFTPYLTCQTVTGCTTFQEYIADAIAGITGGTGTDTYVTGGTYNQSNGIATFTNNTGGTFNVSGFTTPQTDVYVSGGTFDDTTGVATFTNTTGGTFTVGGFSTGDSLWEVGSAGNFSLKAINDSTLDAIGDYSTASGFRTYASGANSFAEGDKTNAVGHASHAEGHETTAEGDYSHAEGWLTIASGNGSHAEGQETTASERTAHAEGLGTTASGRESHAEGAFTTASGEASHSEGQNTIASGDYSHAEGQTTIASGTSAHSEGQETVASGQASHAEGYLTTASDLFSHAEGQGTTASSRTAHAEGYFTIASGSYSHAEGYFSVASGQTAHSEGASTIAGGVYSHSEGYLSIATGATSHAEGNTTTAGGSSSHSEGYLSKAIGQFSHAEGFTTIAGGATSHAEGNTTTASGQRSHAEGSVTIASGIASHSEGQSTTASGNNSHAGGFNSIASGDNSFVHGSASTASGTNTIVLGANITGITDNTVYVPYLNIGIVPSGTSVNNLGVDSDGNVIIGGVSTSTQTVWKSTTDSPELSGVTGYNLIGSQLIPGGTFQAGDILRIRSRIQKTNNGAIYGSHIYIRTTNVLAGATLLATYNTTGTTIRSSQIKRDFVIKSATRTESFFVTTSLITDEIAGTSQPLSLTNIDWTVDQYIMFAINTASATDRFTQTYYIIEKL